MGSILKAICKCGFESEDIFAGGGFQNFRTTCNAPAICLKCKKLLVKNYLQKHEKCPDCGENITFYDDPKLQTQKNSSKKLTNIFSWRARILSIPLLPFRSHSESDAMLLFHLIGYLFCSVPCRNIFHFHDFCCILHFVE